MRIVTVLDEKRRPRAIKAKA